MTTCRRSQIYVTPLQTLGFTPAVAGVAFLPMVAGLVTSSALSNVVLMPRTGPRPLAPAGMLISAAGLVLLTRIGLHSSYATAVLPSLILVGAGFGLVFAPVFNSGTSGVAPHDAGVASPPPPPSTDTPARS